jgi:uncharacterized membrane protein YccC
MSAVAGILAARVASGDLLVQLLIGSVIALLAWWFVPTLWALAATVSAPFKQRNEARNVVNETRSEIPSLVEQALTEERRLSEQRERDLRSEYRLEQSTNQVPVDRVARLDALKAFAASLESVAEKIRGQQKSLGMSAPNVDVPRANVLHIAGEAQNNFDQIAELIRSAPHADFSFTEKDAAFYANQFSRDLQSEPPTLDEIVEALGRVSVQLAAIDSRIQVAWRNV